MLESWHAPWTLILAVKRDTSVRLLPASRIPAACPRVLQVPCYSPRPASPLHQVSRLARAGALEFTRGWPGPAGTADASNACVTVARNLKNHRASQWSDLRPVSRTTWCSRYQLPWEGDGDSPSRSEIATAWLRCRIEGASESIDGLVGDRHVIDVDGGRIRTKAVGTDADFQTIVNRTGQRQGLTLFVDQLPLILPQLHLTVR